MVYGRFPPDDEPAPREHVRVRDVTALLVIAVGAVGLLVVLYLLHPLLAAAAICLAVIGGGVVIGLD